MAAFTIRIPDALRQHIKDAARDDKRSMNSEIEWLLAAALKMRENETRG